MNVWKKHKGKFEKRKIMLGNRLSKHGMKEE